jgi:hypothetical protein
MQLGPPGLKGVMTQVLNHLNKNINICILIHVFLHPFQKVK